MYLGSETTLLISCILINNHRQKYIDFTSLYNKTLTLKPTFVGFADNFLIISKTYIFYQFSLFEMSFKLKTQQIATLFNPDAIHRGISLQKLKQMGKISAFQSLLKTNFHKGLLNDRNEHIQRRAHFGSNQSILKKQLSVWDFINKNFEDELIRLMIFAGVLSLVLGVITEGLRWGWIEGFSIFSAVALVIFLSSINDYANEKSFQLIKGKAEKEPVRVYRSGKMYLLDPEELMVGDIVEIMGGDMTTVDGVLISGEDVLIDQSQITGQAVEVKKQVPVTYQRYEGADPFILSGSKIMAGMGIKLVLAVGPHSYYGSVTTKMNEEHIDSPLKAKLTDLSNEMNDSGQFLGIITFTSLMCHYIYWCFQDDNPMVSLFSSHTLHHLVQAILVTFTIDVALPESLPLLVTIALSVTAKQLEKQKIFVKHLNECETMGSIDNLCLSKTGFVSKNLLSVSQIFVQQRITNIISQQIMSESTCNILNLAIIMNTMANPKFIQQNGTTMKIEHIGNKTQSALLQMAFRMGYNYQRFRINSKVKRIYSTTIPKKKMATIYKDEQGKLFLFAKGSPRFLLPYCSYYINRYEQIVPIDKAARQKIINAMEHFAKSNQKVVMIAYKDVNGMPSKWSQVDSNLILIAMIGIKDSIRSGVQRTIKECENLGITVRMLSNENRLTAIGAAKESGLLPQSWIDNGKDYTIIEGADFRELVAALVKQDKQSVDRKLAVQNFKIVKESLKLIYRASAEDKLLLALGLKECGHIVAVAGNGTNDTEALRKADVSIAMGLTCNQTAKQASDIVILDDNFQSILKTIRWGRHTMNSIKKFLALQLTINIVAAVMALFGAVFVGESPLNPMQMLWINLVIDILGSISLILQAPLRKYHHGTPHSRKIKILTPDMFKIIIVQTLIQVIILSWVLFYGPQLFDIVSSVGVTEFNKSTGKHYSIFFNIFILLQIFNQYNVRILNFQKFNIFSGLANNPSFLCFSVLSFLLQFWVIKYGGSLMHVTELSFKENMFCFIVASLSLSGNYLVKIMQPNLQFFSRFEVKWGNWTIWSKQAQVPTEQQQNAVSSRPLSESQLQELSPQFNLFLTKRRTRYNKFSYIEQKDTIRDTAENMEIGSRSDSDDGELA